VNNEVLVQTVTSSTSVPLARHALVFMIFGLTSNWKQTAEYYLTWLLISNIDIDIDTIDDTFEVSTLISTILLSLFYADASISVLFSRSNLNFQVITSLKMK
jgi:hypothetical protein